MLLPVRSLGSILVVTLTILVGGARQDRLTHAFLNVCGGRTEVVFHASRSADPIDDAVTSKSAGHAGLESVRRSERVQPGIVSSSVTVPALDARELGTRPSRRRDAAALASSFALRGPPLLI